MVFWVMMLCSDVGDWHFGRLCHLLLQGVEAAKVLWNVGGILPHHCMASKPRRPWLEFHHFENLRSYNYYYSCYMCFLL